VAGDRDDQRNRDPVGIDLQHRSRIPQQKGPRGGLFGRVSSVPMVAVYPSISINREVGIFKCSF
jgi:hypothetical protein